MFNVQLIWWVYLKGFFFCIRTKFNCFMASLFPFLHHVSHILPLTPYSIEVWTVFDDQIKDQFSFHTWKLQHFFVTKIAKVFWHVTKISSASFRSPWSAYMTHHHHMPSFLLENEASLLLRWSPALAAVGTAAWRYDQWGEINCWPLAGLTSLYSHSALHLSNILSKMKMSLEKAATETIESTPTANCCWT